MLKFEVNNKSKIELKQHDDGEGVLLHKYDNNGKLERADYISAGDFILLINYYKYQKENNKEIF